MINKIVDSGVQALDGLQDGATLLVSGFGDAGMPHHLVRALVEKGTRDLTIVTNNAGVGKTGIGALFANGQIRKIICSFPRSSDSSVFDELYVNEAGFAPADILRWATRNGAAAMPQSRFPLND